MNGLVVAASVVSAIGALIGGGAAWYANAMRRKIHAEARKAEVEPDVLVSQAAMEMYDRLRGELKDTRAELSTERERRERVEAHVRELEDVLRQHGITPPRWPPLESVQ